MTYYAPNTYHCQVIEQGFAESQEKKTPFFYLKFYPHVEGQESYERDVRFYITDKTARIVVRKLRQIGWNGNDFSELEPNGTHSFLNTTVELECKHETNGNYTNEKWDVPFESQGPEHQSGISKRLSTLYRDELNLTPATASPTSAATERPEHHKGDIPF